MLGWADQSEEDICLSCHRSFQFSWRVRKDGGKVEGVHPTVAVAAEPDASDPAVTWVTMQTRCTCGARAGRVVEVHVELAEGSGPNRASS